jgi:hypothetical protein
MENFKMPIDGNTPSPENESEIVAQKLIETLKRRENDYGGPNLREDEQDGFTKMKPEWAKTLTGLIRGRFARFKLMNVETMDDESIKKFAESSVNSLLLGIKELSKQGAENLGKFTGHQLYLDKIKDMDVETAKALTQADRKEGEPSDRKNYSLSLDSLKNPNLETLEALARSDVYDLDIGIEDLTPEKAEILSRFEGKEIKMNHLKKLTPEAAKNLIKFKGKLELWIAEPINEETAKILAKKIKGEAWNRLSLNINDGEGKQFYDKGEITYNHTSMDLVNKNRSWIDRNFNSV